MPPEWLPLCLKKRNRRFIVRSMPKRQTDSFSAVELPGLFLKPREARRIQTMYQCSLRTSIVAKNPTHCTKISASYQFPHKPFRAHRLVWLLSNLAGSDRVGLKYILNRLKEMKFYTPREEWFVWCAFLSHVVRQYVRGPTWFFVVSH